MTAYVPTTVCVAAPPVKMEETTPGTELEAVAECAAPSYVIGEFETVRVGVAFCMTKFPALAPASEL